MPRRLVTAAILFAIVPALSAQELPAAPGSAIDSTIARRIFDEAREISDRDGGALWGVPLAGPVMLVDPVRRNVIANQPDSAGVLARNGSMWTGVLPPEVPVANYAGRWSGTLWTIVMWPLPPDAERRHLLLAHEMWHRIQRQLGLPATMASNAHLDQYDGRLWLRLEGRALRAALLANGAERRMAMSDALRFRHWRQNEFPGADSGERVLELNEGMANYTGVRLAGGTRQEQELRAADILLRLDTLKTMARGFAYTTGPAYGLFLDEAAPGWPRQVRPNSDLAGLLANAIRLDLGGLDSARVMSAARKYGYQEVAGQEARIADDRNVRLVGFRKRFVEGPVLQLPMMSMQIEMGPSAQESLDTLGVVYPAAKIAATWGILRVTGGALLRWNEGQVVVVVPTDPAARPLSGDGWTLELKDGWTIAAGERQGDWVVQRVSQ